MPEWTEDEYTEAQYHGDITLNDVESIHISPHKRNGRGGDTRDNSSN